MADAVKVIRGLEFCLKVTCTASSGEKCPYIGSECADGCIYEMQSDALQLIREQNQRIWELLIEKDEKAVKLDER